MNTVLLIDDVDGHRNVTQRFLEAKKFRVVTATNGLMGLKLLEGNTPFDLVISDMEMPVMNGMEFLVKARQLPRYQSVPIVMLSSVQNTATINKVLKLGATEYLLKPYTVMSFNAVLQKIGFAI